MIRAGRVLKCEEVSTLGQGAFTEPSSIFIAPVGDTLAVGDVVIVQGVLSYAGSSDLIPVVVGDWSPAIFDEITSICDTSDTELSSTDYRLFAAEIKID